MNRIAPIEEWVPADFLADDPAVENRNRFARKFADEADLDHILKLWAYMTLHELSDEYGQVIDAFGIDTLSGAGVEVGAGLGSFSSYMVKRFPAITSIHAVELVPEVVRVLQRRVIEAVAGEAGQKVISVIGSFNDLKFPDTSLDFALEFDALHHSDDLDLTLGEISRVLKPGGRLLMIDRAHPECLSDAQREFMLAVLYPDAWKERYGFAPTPLTRRQNGEHEYRISEWQAAFHRAGFELLDRVEIRPVSWGTLGYKMRLKLPFLLRKMARIHPSRVSPTTTELFWMMKRLITGSNGDGFFRSGLNEHTLFSLRRR